MPPSQDSAQLTSEQLREIAYANAYRELQCQGNARPLLHPLPACPTCKEAPTQIHFPIYAALTAESPDDNVQVAFLNCRHQFPVPGIDVERADRRAREAARNEYNGPVGDPARAQSSGDWHETLVDLLANGRGIPEDRARRFLARHAEEVHAAAPIACHARECPCPPGCDCCPALPASQDVAHWELAAHKNGDLYSGAENQRDAAREQLAEARATIARCQAVARDWEFMSGRTAARRELLAALAAPTEEQQ